MSPLVCTLLYAVVCTTAAEEGHGHEAHAWEWAGAVKLEAAETYIWTAARNANMVYADPTWQVYFTSATTSDSEGIESAEETAETGFNTTATLAPPGHTLTPGTLWTLQMDQESFMTQWKLAPAATSPYIIFSQHMPSEFEGKLHFLKSDHGTDIETDATEPAAAAVAAPGPTDHGNEYMGEAVIAAILVNLCTFIGIFTAAPKLDEWIKPTYAAVFASGALITISSCLIFPEAVHHMGSLDESVGNGVFGAFLVLGFVLSLSIEWLSSTPADSTVIPAPRLEQNTAVASANLEEELGSGDAEKADEKASPKTPETQAMQPVVKSVLVGDFLHNFGDGIAIAAAFMGCGPALGWTVTAGAVAHELSQELSDFLILTKVAGLSRCKALTLNALSGLSCVIGLLVTYATKPSNPAIGAMLAFSGGTYLYLATIPIWPRVLQETQNKGASNTIAKHAFVFVLGCVAIGLVLLNHTHCVPPPPAGAPPAAEGDAHAGHGH
jgi:zinc transporter ZupT